MMSLEITLSPLGYQKPAPFGPSLSGQTRSGIKAKVEQRETAEKILAALSQGVESGGGE
jgi:hypothetical protein